MFFRSKPEKAKDKSVAKAKSVGDAAAARGASLGSSVLSSAASALNAVSDSVSPKAAAAASTAKEKTEGARAAALDRTEGARAAAMERTAEAREVAREKTGDALSRAAVARDSAVSGLDRGIDTAVPAMQQGVAGVGDKVDSARDVIVEDVLPKLQELLGSFQTQKDEVLAKPDGAVAAVTGAPKKGPKKGGFLIALGLLAAIGAGVAYYLSQQQGQSGEDDTDPWAGTTDDGSGVAGSAAASSATTGSAAASSGATAATETSAEPAATDTASDSGEDHVAAAPAAGSSEDLDAHEESDPEELPKMVDVDDVPGAEAGAQSGFGTDFSDEDTAANDDDPSEGKHRA